MSSDFGYINARVRGLKARLLGPEFYSEALGASDFRALASTLSQTPYMREMEEAQSRYQGLGVVDTALAQNFYRTTQSILGFSDGEPGRLIALTLMRYDLANIKAIVRAKHAGRDLEEIREALLPAGRLKPAVLENVAAASDIPAVAQALAATRHPLARALGRAAARYGSDAELYPLELALDRAYFDVVLDEARRGGAPAEFFRHIQREVDATNLRTALKLRPRAAGDGDLFVRGGKEIGRQAFDAMLGSDGSAALQELAGTSFAAVLDAEGPSEAEEAIRSALDQSAHRLASRNPLGIGVVLYYLRLKESEAARIRLLARGKFYGVPRERLERELGNA